MKVGDILSFKSRVWATRGSLAYVNVESRTLTPATGEEKDACSFSFVFRALQSSPATPPTATADPGPAAGKECVVHPVDFPRSVVPTSYLQALCSIRGKRRLAEVARSQPTDFV